MLPQDLIEWTFKQNKPTIVTTSFGDQSAVLIHMVKEINPRAKFVWIDTQFNTQDTLKYVNEQIHSLYMNIYPFWGESWTSEIPLVDTPEHDEFVEQVKLIPFRRAIAQLRPEFWITGLRQEQTEHRMGLKPIDQVNGITKISPLLDWTTAEMNAYLEYHGLPNETNYFDPTKVHNHRECGLHTTLHKWYSADDSLE